VSEQVDSISHASLSGLYVKAQELDRGHNDHDAPAFAPAGQAGDAPVHAESHASDAESHASDAESHASDAESHATG